MEISLKSGHQATSTLGYTDKMQDSDNDYWDFDKSGERPLPLKHIKYKKDGDVDFVETWNYDVSNPVKYEMLDGNGKVVSIKKETLDNDNNLRVEHLIYDKDGKTKINVTASYEGADLKRFTYYNADKLSESGSVFGEYKDGLKTKEVLYSSDLKIENVYEPEYKDGIKENIKVLNEANNVVDTVYSE